MPPGDPAPGSIERFAADLVGIDPAPGGADPRDRLPLFRKLLDDNFLPDPLAHQAILALAGRPVAADSLLIEAAGEAEGRRLFAEVEDFADGFFDEPVARRVDRYRRLGLACARHPRLIERLRLLRPGLMLDRSAVADRSPLVNRLLDDLFALFPMRPAPRAVEARERSDDFRSDIEWTDANRARALRDLARRHPEVVALVPDYPAGLAKGRRRRSANRALADVVERVGSSGQRSAWIIAVLGISSLARLVGSISSTPSAPSLANLRSAPLNPTGIQETMNRFVRDQFKGPIRAELAKLGKAIDGGQLERVVLALPVEELPPDVAVEGAAGSRRWAATVRDRFLARLKAALKATNLGLTDAQIDDLAPRCFPEATPPRSP